MYLLFQPTIANFYFLDLNSINEQIETNNPKLI